jgi:ubiquinone/menaquinone biosynthesis C-methylase UbiE
VRATRGAGLADIVVPVHADARELPHPDATFDAAYLCTNLGEVPDVDAALAELRRVLRRVAGWWWGSVLRSSLEKARDLQAARAAGRPPA